MSKIGFIHFSDFHIKKTDASFFNGSPIAKLTSYSISLMSGNFNFTDMETLRDEFDEKKILALSLLKDITRRYVYTNNVSYQKKQRIATSLKMSSFRPIANG